MNNTKKQQTTERIITYLFQMTVCCGVFLLLMVLSHSVIAQPAIVTTDSNVDQARQDIVIAVFDDHEKQIKSSRPYGLSWRLIEMAAEAEKVNLLPIATTWQSAMNRLKDERLDLVFGAFKTEQRSQWASFSLPLATDYSALFTTVENPVREYSDINLEYDTVGVISNSVQEDLAHEFGFEHIYSARERQHLVRLLQSGRINYILQSHGVTVHYCEYKAPCLQQVGDPLSVNYSRVMAKQGTHAAGTLERINQGLAKLYLSQDVQFLFAEYGYSDDYYQQWKLKLEHELPNKPTLYTVQ
ncbi:substrate-binding periplasmic protein [Planctobacterium marinum]|uniref:substrate-binding periplasmic protein n=1 Tax=Planctobacterium marinum TaxID=1631968 RepID=UPI001E58B02F|nr:transporter substrate-binding domain-containing protein [Planctobacterium marinum]MCC2604612.1 transporter substrate-binding domain-containing protein [Planctobacterium marinum]